MSKPQNDGGPAFPSSGKEEAYNQLNGSVRYFESPSAPGLTKREYFAGLAMQANLSHPQSVSWSTEIIVAQSVEAADALLAELNKPNT